MTHDVNITKTRGFKKLMIFLLIGIVFFSLLLFKNVFGATLFDDSFESYELGELVGQGGWLGSTGYYNVVDTLKHSGAKGVEINTASTSIGIYKTTTALEVGEFSIWFYPITGEMRFEFYTESDNPAWYSMWFKILKDNGTADFYHYISTGFTEIFSNLTLETWHLLEMDWFKDGNRIKYRLKLDSGDWTDYYDIGYDITNIVGVNKFRLEGGAVHFAFDDIGEGVALPVRIFGISPVSGTEVSDLNLEITIGYEGFDWEEYAGFTIAFWDERLHASSGVKVYVEDDLDPSGAGEIIVNLTDFGLDKKGRWYLTGLGFGTHLDIQSGMFLTTLGYVDFWSDELVDPEYYFIVIAPELPDLYPISDFEIWYGDNVVEFLEPTSFALAIAGFFQPILEKIGEFHERTQIYLDTNEAYVRGKSLGDVFPILTGYVANISYFMGGFPLVSWFKYILIVLFAIFIIRTIFKFIPFFG